MSPYLVFRLYGAMASFGEIAVGELRHSAAYPSRSALLGLLGAALGIARSNEAGQQALI
ncbi:MAG: CRISPR-associated protein Cas5, partial [Iodobacter sp.]